MLDVQKFLQDHSYDDLTNEFGIVKCFHDDEPLVILNYSQIESPKTHPISRECRALVLNSETNELVARSMNRFFNWGELTDEMKLFNFDDFNIQTKEDGSLVLIYYWNNQWRINTRGSFGHHQISFHDLTWREAILKGLGLSERDLEKQFDKNVTYVCEFCSLWNKVVRIYKQPVVYLLTAFRGYNELTIEECDALAEETSMVRPQRFHFTNIDCVQEYISEVSKSDMTYEGVVLRDSNNLRYKVKSPSYFGLHKLRGDGDNLFNPKHLIPFILEDDSDELMTYFPEVEEQYRKVESIINEEFQSLAQFLETVQGIESQKDFAMSVKGNKFSGLMFSLRRRYGPIIPQDALKEIWRESGDVIHKWLFVDKHKRKLN